MGNIDYIVVIEKQDDGSYTAYNKELEGVVIGTGETVEEAKNDYLNTLEEIKEIWAEEGKEIPEVCKSNPKFKFDIASLFDYYSSINMSGFAKFVGINASLLRQYKRGDTYISDAQLQKIEEGIHALGKELVALKLV